jgi:hypothetical protein
MQKKIIIDTESSRAEWSNGKSVGVYHWAQMSEGKRSQATDVEWVFWYKRVPVLPDPLTGAKAPWYN